MSCLNKPYDKFEGGGAMGSKFRARCCGSLIFLGATALLALIVMVAVRGDGKSSTAPTMIYNTTGSARQDENDMEEIIVTQRGSFADAKTTVPPETAENGDAEEYVKPTKLGPRSLHDYDRLYDQMRNDNSHPQIRHHSGHFRHKPPPAVWDPHPEYEIDAFGKKLVLDLAFNNNISPNLHVINVWSNFTQRVKHDAPYCFYTGTVKGDVNSYVHVSLCGGMTGYIKTTEANYVIQPVEPLQENSSSSVLHLIKKSVGVDFDAAPKTPLQQGGEDVHRSRRSLNLPYFDIYDDFVDENDPMHYQTYVHSYFIETLVVVDPKMLQYHKTQTALVNYVLTLMSHVALLFKDASIGNPITLSISDVIVVRDREFSGESQKMLRQFCEFQHSHSDNKHDVALLLTSKDLCMNSPTDQHCSTLGVAEVGSMCSPTTSCAIAKDKGLSTSYAIAHEFGHVLNMPHDDDKRCAKFQKGVRANKIMSRSLNNDTNSWQWSNCSKHFLTEFLESPRSRCLLDKPDYSVVTKEFPDFPATEILPGEKFEVNKQCEMVFGNGSQICTFMPYCESLWCTSDQGEDSGCHTQHMPWGEGTSCGDGMWCHQRKCVPKDRNILSPTAGGWTDWKEWSECSRTCGGGIMLARRECRNPAPANGGPYCTGGSVRYMHCNTEPCQSNVPDFREQQCAEFNGNPMGLLNLTTDVVWFPKYGAGDKDDYCKLFCRVGKSAMYYLLRNKVIDGTKCGVNSYNICVNGVCKRAGCDNRLGSNATLDGCGVCGGDGSTCEKIDGYFNETCASGYNQVTVIPKGSLHFKVTQNGGNFLALRDSVTGEYILNGQFTISTYKKEIVYGGLILMYSRFGSSQVVESVQALHNSHLKQDLIVEVLTDVTQEPANINYTYTMPLENKPRYKWVYKDNRWSSCTSICEGRQKWVPVCVDVARNQVTRSSFCPDMEESVRTCNGHCRLSWVESGKTACSTECGPGTRSVIYGCEKRSLRSEEREFVDDKHCQYFQRPEQRYEPCEGPCNRAAWSYSEWSHCAKRRDGCNQTRGANCLGADGEYLDGRYCAERGAVTRECAPGECPNWSYGDWSPCSVSCGAGYQSRLYSCHVDGHPIDANYCDAETLADRRECDEGPCGDKLQWNTSNWRGCSVECGTGEQERDVFCVAGARTIDDSYCVNYNLLRPNSSRPCKQHCSNHHNYHSKKLKPMSSRHYPSVDYSNSGNNILPSYDYGWQSGQWSECSKSCGGGYRRRFVDCVKDPRKTHCPGHSKPAETEPCNEHQCPKWVFTRWSKCLDDCTKKREVLCRDYRNAEVDDAACSPPQRRKPPTSKNCRKSQCHRNGFKQRNQGKTVTYYEKDSNTTRLLTWRFGKWSKCCEGDTHKFRPVFCFDKSKEVTFVDALCENNDLVRPRSRAVCKRRMRCPQVYTWRAAEWSECNCDKSNPYQRRAIKCVNSRGDPVSHELCAKKSKPQHKITCAYKCDEYSSCRDVKIRGGTNKNDDYKLVLYGREAMVHCFQMDTDNPEEYITLKPNSENYAEIYAKRLNNIYSCPYNGQRNDNCDCHIPMDNHGKTEFWKVRLNITSMQIITNVFTFASGQGPNKKISFGTAGDCYSEVNCPQGRFSIDLTGTSFKLLDNVKWVASGSKASLRIHPDYSKQKVTGQCGGSCGYCNPDPNVGLNVEVIDINR